MLSVLLGLNSILVVLFEHENYFNYFVVIFVFQLPSERSEGVVLAKVQCTLYIYSSRM